jgi:AraC family transcriptional regulator of adaptative response / DNA-3-methyladenine glycosylase II
VAKRPGLRVPGGWDGFEIAVRAVLGQQVTVQGGVQAVARLAAAIGPALPETLRLPGLTHAFPGPALVTLAACQSIGATRARAAALFGLAQAALTTPDLFGPQRSLEEAVRQLCGVPGIGEWSAQYIALRAMRESDAFLAGDAALRRILRQRLGIDTPRTMAAKVIVDRAENWRPWRAYALLHLWTAEADTDQENDDATVAA